MGDSGEGLVDTHARLEERLEEREKRVGWTRRPVSDPETEQRLESLRLARKEIERQWALATLERRRDQLKLALDELDRRMSELQGTL